MQKKKKNEFELYLKELAQHEENKTGDGFDARNKILVNAGIRLNWMGDFLANPRIKYSKKNIEVNRILFTGTSLKWNKILIDKCERKVNKFLDFLENDKRMYELFKKEASFGNEIILLRGPDEEGCFRVLDGMHRFVGAVLEKKETIVAYVPINEDRHLPICEAHVVYDLIRGFQRNARDKQGEKELYYALKLLSRTYENVIDLLKDRFNEKYVMDDNVQKVIKKVLSNNNTLR